MESSTLIKGLFIISLVMDVELSLNKFVESSIKHKIKEDDEVPYSEHHANLLVIFCFSIADKNSP